MDSSSYWPYPACSQANRLFLRTSPSPRTRTPSTNSSYDRCAVQSQDLTIGCGNGQRQPQQRPGKRQESIMPVTSGSQSLLASLPTFMSVFGEGPASRDAQVTAPAATSSSAFLSSTTSNAKLSSTSHLSRTHIPSNFRSNHSSLDSSDVTRRGSATTTESTESSPTTTISTLDSSLTEPSPSSSPESPASLSPLASIRTLKVSTSDMGDSPGLSPNHSPLNGTGTAASSPNKRPRNMKNLSVNTGGAARSGSASSLPRMPYSDPSSGPSGHALSAPASPFVMPMVPKRKPSKLGLSLETSESNGNGLKRNEPDGVPQTPSFARFNTVRQVDLSTVPPIFSPGVAPEGGMQLPPFSAPKSGSFSKARPALSLSHHSSFDSSNTSPIVQQTLEHVQEEVDHDLPLSREIQSPAYPNGPACIYPPNVFLYLEPNDDEASKFDVVINVAREVLNPFDAKPEPEPELEPEPAFKDVGVQVNFMKDEPVFEPFSAASEKSFASAMEEIPDEDATPDTPRARKLGPEYIHMPWEHNTKVSLELLELCELIDDRVKKGKRVLIHCQCGVSRSASLIIAYGIYKNPELSDQEAYNNVKARSRWINPNMHFIFELHAFKQMLMERNAKASQRRPPPLSRSMTDGAINSKLKILSPLSPIEDEPASAPIRGDHDPLSPLQSPPLSAMPEGANDLPGPSAGVFHTRFFSPTTQPSPAFTPSDSMFSPGMAPLPTGRPADSMFSQGMAPLPTGRQSSFFSPAMGPLPTGRLPPSRPFMTLPSMLPHRSSFQEAMQKQNGTTENTPMQVDTPPALGKPFKLEGKPANRDIEMLASPGPRPTPAALRMDFSKNKPSPLSSIVITAGKDTEDLPSPHLNLPVPPRTLRPSPSLPAGFSSIISRRAAPRAPPLNTNFAPAASGPGLFQFTLDHPMPDADSPSLLSPRVAKFTASPFHRTAAGDLAGSSIFGQGLFSPTALDRDPRSPPMRGEAPITRSIDDVL